MMGMKKNFVGKYNFRKMDIVSFETAKRLKDAGFPQPPPAFGQFWYDDRDVLFFVVESFDENPIPFNGIWVIEKGGEVIHVNRGVFSESLIYAPSPTELLEKIPYTPVFCDGPGSFAFSGDFTGKENLCELLAERLINA